MKHFFASFIACFVMLVIIALIMANSNNFYLWLAIIALVMSVFITFLVRQDERMSKLEQELDALLGKQKDEPAAEE